jgi:trk system potassium uptake protein
MVQNKVLVHMLNAWDTLQKAFKSFLDGVYSLLNVSSSVVCLGGFVLLVLDFGFHLSTPNIILFTQIQFYFLAYFIGDVLLRLLIRKNRLTYFFSSPTDTLVFYPILYFLPSHTLEYSYFFSQMALLIIIVGRLSHFKILVTWLKIKPAQIFLLGFLFSIFLGSLLLTLPISTYAQDGILYIDALFTAFSAVCVTGLVVNDIGTTFTLFGQSVILILIQIGGLGIMSFSILIALLLHRRVSQTASSELQENYSTISLSETFNAIAFIFKVTIVVELLGSGGLFFYWYGNFSHWSEDLFVAVFHSVSAFCNAGFSLFPDSLMMYSAHAPIIGIISLLIIIGGLGFPVLFNVIQNRHHPFRRLKIQTKLALQVTLALTIVGTLGIYAIERNRSLLGLDFIEQLLISFFQSVSSRTAGFNSVDIQLFHPATLVGIMILMVIGASPGSTGGGIKTTTFGLMLVSFWHTLKSAKRIELSGRTIKFASILRAFSLFLLAIMVISFFFFILLLTEDKPMIALLFETISAVGTVGFSLGVTSDLSNLGKAIIMVLMFVGRIGPLTVAMALSKPKPEARHRYPEESIIIV